MGGGAEGGGGVWKDEKSRMDGDEEVKEGKVWWRRRKAKKTKWSKQIDVCVQSTENWTLNLLRLFQIRAEYKKIVDQFGGRGKEMQNAVQREKICFSTFIWHMNQYKCPRNIQNGYELLLPGVPNLFPSPIFPPTLRLNILNQTPPPSSPN